MSLILQRIWGTTWRRALQHVLKTDVVQMTHLSSEEWPGTTTDKQVPGRRNSGEGGLPMLDRTEAAASCCPLTT